MHPPVNSEARRRQAVGEPLEVETTPKACLRMPTFTPYKTATLDAPMFHMVLKPLCLGALRPVSACLYRIRWMLQHPMNTPILPRWVPSVVPLRNLTVGEVILIFPLAIFALRGYHYTFSNPSGVESGVMASYAIYWSFLTASKSNSIFSFLFGIPFERLIPLHLFSSLIAVMLGCFHAYASYRIGGDSVHSESGADPDMTKFLFDTNLHMTGTILLACLIALLITSTFPILRRVLFNLWYFTHIVLGVGVIVYLLLHSVGSALFVAVWWGLDLVVRYGIMAGCRNRAESNIRCIGHDNRGIHEPSVEVSFLKPPGFEYNPGQFAQIAFPALSIFEFHPVSFSSAPHEDMVTFHIRKLGDWTSRLVDLAKSVPTTHIWFEGPYGSLSFDLDDDMRYKTALIICGGIGVTPCQSVGKSLLHAHKTLGRRLKEVRFVWVVRDLRIVGDIPPLEGDQDYSSNGPWYRQFSRSDHNDESTPAGVQVDIFCTRSTKDEERETGSLSFNLHHGRPDLDAIFKDMKRSAIERGETCVAVFGCGPISLMSELQEACHKHSVAIVGCEHGVFFDLHSERFCM
jgi:predicted ferric reductase